MSRSEEFAAGSSRYHPNVQHYRDGGMGGIGPDRSVVGMVPTHVLAAYRHHDGRWDGQEHQWVEGDHIIQGLRKDLREGVGIKEPLMLEYDHKSQWAYLGEGNHRLQAAIEEGVPEVPVRVVRSPYGVPRRKEEGVGAPATHTAIPGAREGYIPTDIHPSFLEFRGSHEARSVHEEIHDLLQPHRGQR